MTETVTHRGGCHCGTVRFQFRAPAQTSMTICNCSMCRLTAYQHVFIPQTELTFLSGEDHLSLYTFNTGAAKHLFCQTCGIKPLYIPRSHPDSYSVNYRCIDAGTMTITETIQFDGGNWDANIADLRGKT